MEGEAQAPPNNVVQLFVYNTPKSDIIKRAEHREAQVIFIIYGTFPTLHRGADCSPFSNKLGELLIIIIKSF